MKKIGLCLVIIILAVATLLLSGCNESLTKPDIRQELIAVPENWANIYGDDFESQQTANIALAIQVINKQAEAIRQLDGRLIVLEGLNDPNNLIMKISALEENAIMSGDEYKIVLGKDQYPDDATVYSPRRFIYKVDPNE